MGVLWIISLWRPAILVGLILTQFAVEQVLQSGIQIFSYQQALFNFLVGGGTLATIAVNALDGRIVLGFGKTNIFIALVVAWALLSVLWTPDRAETIALVVEMLPYLGLISFVTPHLICSLRDLHDAVISFFVVMVPVCATALFTEWGARGIAVADDLTGNPLALASAGSLLYLVSVTTLSLHAYRIHTTGLALFLTAALGLYVCYSTGSRGQFWAAIFISAAYLILQFRRNFPQFIFLLPVSLFVLIVSEFDVLALFTGRWSFESSLASIQGERFDNLVKPIFDEWTRHGGPTYLIGLGQGASYYYNESYPHLVLFEILVEQGIIGLLITIASAIAVFRMYLISCPRKTLTSQNLRLKLADHTFLSFSLFFLILSFKQGSFLGSFDMYGAILILMRCGKLMEMKRDPLAESAGNCAGFASLWPEVGKG